MDLMGKRVVVIGLGKSGHAAVSFCAREGASVVVFDSRPQAALEAELTDLVKQGARVQAQGAPADWPEGKRYEPALELFKGADLVVVSPGVPPLAVLDEVVASGVEVVGELELATRFIEAPILAVGGTNGKSTTTTLLATLLKAVGANTFAGGNLGTPLSAALLSSAAEDYDLFVLEVSSFQLERAPTFRPRVSILLNVSEDHLDRYPNFEAYLQAKGNAFQLQTPQDYAIIPWGDKRCEAQARRGHGQLITVGSLSNGSASKADEGPDYQVLSEPEPMIVEKATGERFSLKGVDLNGTHNWLNAAAAIAAARACGLGPDAIRAGLKRFKALPHRMQVVGEVKGIPFYDDSKATNVDAARTALLGLSHSKAVLIAGGRDKGGSYEPLIEALKAKGRGLVLIGEAAEKIAEIAGDRVPWVKAEDLPHAVSLAHSLAQKGEAVLLSPACSSFDMFQDYEDRGRRFAEAVQQLAGKQRTGPSRSKGQG